MARHSRRARPGPRLLALPLVMLVAAPFAVTPSAAAWNDVEHVSGALASATCATGNVSSGSGVLASGAVLGQSLAPVADLDGASATSPGTGAAVVSSDPLSVSALSALNAQLGGVLQFDLGAEAGALRQFAEARPTGWSGGSAGSVANAGAIDLAVPSPGGPVPRFATLHLGSVLSQLVGGGFGGGIAGLSDAHLSVGALASYATLDGCAANWSGDVYSSLDREYLLAGLGATLGSPLATALATTTTSGAGTIDGLIAAVAGQSGLLNSISSATLDALTSTLAGFVVGTPVTTLALDIDLSGLAANIATPIGDAAGILSINLVAGTVTVDLARLLGPAYESSVGLNGRAPNTELLLNATAMSALVAAVDSALTGWIAGVGSTVNTAAGVLDVDLKVVVPLSVGVAALGITVPVGTITVAASHVRLDQLLAGTATITTSLQLSPPSCAGVTGAIICGVVNPLLSTLTSRVTALVLNGVLGPVVGGLIRTALTPVPGLASLLSSLRGDADALLSFLSRALGGLFGPDAVLSLVVNAQNAPDPAEESSPPGALPAWSDLDTSSASPYRTGEYAVAALRLVTLGVVSGGVALDLARSVVGSNGPR